MFELKIKNASTEDSYRTFQLSAEEWERWREVLVGAGVCGTEAFRGSNRRLVITYYPGTLPAAEEDEDILSLLE
jgi:hypothetical protein